MLVWPPAQGMIKLERSRHWKHAHSCVHGLHIEWVDTVLFTIRFHPRTVVCPCVTAVSNLFCASLPRHPPLVLPLQHPLPLPYPLPHPRSGVLARTRSFWRSAWADFALLVLTVGVRGVRGVRHEGCWSTDGAAHWPDGCWLLLWRRPEYWTLWANERPGPARPPRTATAMAARWPRTCDAQAWAPTLRHCTIVTMSPSLNTSWRCADVWAFGIRDKRLRVTNSKVDFVLYKHRFHFLYERLLVKRVVVASFYLDQNLGHVLKVQG